MEHFERINPRDSRILLLTRKGHIERYRLAAKLMDKNSRVLDAACGLGYGTTILARRAKSVIGIDSSEEAIKKCNSDYKGNVKFIKGDVESLPFEDESLDVIVGSEMIEHIESPESFLSEAYRLLRPNGQLMISTPYGDNTLLSDGTPFSKYHITEFTKKQMFGMLNSAGFDVKKTYGQYILFGSLMKIFRNNLKPSSNLEKGRIQQILNSLPFVPTLFSRHYSVLKSTSKNMFYYSRKKEQPI